MSAPAKARVKAHTDAIATLQAHEPGLPLTLDRAEAHLHEVVLEFGAAKEKLPDHVERDRAALITVLSKLRELRHSTIHDQQMIASLQAHQYGLLHKIARLERERDGLSSLDDRDEPPPPDDRAPCPYCGRLMSDREHDEQHACNDCAGQS